jgi:hypothetical protein
MPTSSACASLPMKVHLFSFDGPGPDLDQGETSQFMFRSSLGKAPDD